LPDAVGGLAFSPDNQLLAAGLTYGGLRVYAHKQRWVEVARDEDYRGESYRLAFAPDGRLATTSYDGRVRLYSADLTGNIKPTAWVGGHSPGYPFAPLLSHGIAFNSDGTMLAVGIVDTLAVGLLNGRTLALRAGPSLGGIARDIDSDLFEVAWSRDGGTLFAGGRYFSADSSSIIAWGDAGSGTPRVIPVAHDMITGLAPLPSGELLVSAADPSLVLLEGNGRALWSSQRIKADFRDQYENFSVSRDGTLIDFGFMQHGTQRARFDLRKRVLTSDPPLDGRTVTPRLDGGPRVSGWLNTTNPKLNGGSLKLAPYEHSRSFAADARGDTFVLGGDWFLRAFNSGGIELWRRPTTAAVWDVNIAGDGRLVVAAYDDGSIRWHRMADGVELLAFRPLMDGINWVAWTPEGFYAATAGARGFLRWHTNLGLDAPADSTPIEDIPGSFRPAMLPLVLQELETPRAIGLAEMAEHNKQVAIHTHSQLPPGVQLHLLTIGISAYNEEYATNLRLHYADRDARDLASAISSTQEGLYSHVDTQALVDKDATRAGILRGLQFLRSEMERGGGNDLAVVHFSGHGALVDRTLYLLPYNTDARDAVGIKDTALSIDTLKGELLELAKHGRVLVLLDACHSGATTLDGSAKAVDAAELRHELAAANVTVLTSSSGSETSFEEDSWQHGAFTRVLLDALSDPAADPDHVGLINANALAHYVARHVASLTDGKQTPDMEVRFDTTVFAVGL
jgi:WD40 repeat protein